MRIDCQPLVPYLFGINLIMTTWNFLFDTLGLVLAAEFLINHILVLMENC